MTAELYAEGIMGRDAEDFIQGDLGQYLIGCAEQEIKTATDALKKVHPWRTRRIRELQNEIWRAESFQSWLSELVIRGRQAVGIVERAPYPGNIPLRKSYAVNTRAFFHPARSANAGTNHHHWVLFDVRVF